MTWILTLACLSGGLLAGLIGALLGLGGGIIIVPFLHLILNVPMPQAAACGLVSTLSVSAAASGRHLSCAGRIDPFTSVRTQAFTALGGFGGGLLAGVAPVSLVRWLFAGLLLFLMVKVLGRPSAPDCTDPLEKTPPRHLALGLLVCALGGVLSGLLGIGGGAILVPVLNGWLGLSLQGAIASSNFVMGLTALPALLAFIGAGFLDLALAVPVALGVLAGATLGANLMPKIHSRWLKRGLVLVLLWAASEMVYKEVWG